ncbi:hypothetical protein NW768_007678 [Fusarium equiseti]|uniref:Uncharacterized protein n=1 Tax=Fusarium equiseti TaxID=61235 RepID=A0ABQ8R857_FUSEQ|nr:hypothetical protein NW768_007678 [Fusarium equiseti]
MVLSTFLAGALVMAGSRAVIASPCRPLPQVTLSFETAVSLSTSTEALLIPTSSSEPSATSGIQFSETATSLLSTSYAAESFSSTYTSIFETDVDPTGLSSTVESFATETGTTTAVMSDEATGFTTTTSETTTWSISDTVTSAETTPTTTVASEESTTIITTILSETSAWSSSETIATESEVTTWATTETTNEPTTVSMSQTTTEETPASTTVSTLPPIPTFELVTRSQSLGDVVMHSDGRQVLISTYQFPSSWTSSITYDQETQHLKVNGNPLCVIGEPAGRLAGLAGCPSVVAGQYRHLTCQPPSAAGFICNMPAVKCTDAGCTELGYTWNHFYLLGWDEGTWLLVIGADDLTTERDAPLQGLEPVGVDIRTVFSK